MAADNEDSLLRSVARQNPESIRTVRLHAEQQAEATLRERTNLLNLTHDAIFVRDVNGAVKYCNRGAEELHGQPPKRAAGRVIQESLKTTLPVRSRRRRKTLSVQAAGKATFCIPSRKAARLSWPADGPCSVTRGARRLRSFS
jgi:PAS domain-containing protein